MYIDVYRHMDISEVSQLINAVHFRGKNLEVVKTVNCSGVIWNAGMRLNVHTCTHTQIGYMYTMQACIHVHVHVHVYKAHTRTVHSCMNKPVVCTNYIMYMLY